MTTFFLVVLVALIGCVVGIVYLVVEDSRCQAAARQVRGLPMHVERAVIYVPSEQRVDSTTRERAVALLVDREGPGWQAIDCEAQLYDGAWRHAVLCMRRVTPSSDAPPHQAPCVVVGAVPQVVVLSPPPHAAPP